MKCLQYWPETEGESLEFGDIEVHNVGLETWPDFTITQLRLSKVNDLG